MVEGAPFIDAGVFLGMHHEDELTRRRSLAFFRGHVDAEARMNFEQIGICDAIIWQKSRKVQDLYYPFMDRLHSDMRILREGYTFREIDLALSHHELKGLLPEQALLAAQVLHRGVALFTHDPALRRLPCLRSHLGDFEALDPRAAFPPELEALYEPSRSFVHTAEDWDHVATRHFHSADHAA
jgi:predicted nucleic acid-binding protein